MVENLPANAGDTGSSSGLGRSHMPRSNWAREPQLLSLRVWSLCSATRVGRDSERPAHRDEEWPPLATTRESPHTETKTQHSHKKKKNSPLVDICIVANFKKQNKTKQKRLLHSLNIYIFPGQEFGFPERVPLGFSHSRSRKLKEPLCSFSFQYLHFMRSNSFK